MNGPCLCGDPYCGLCGDPGRAELEAAEEWAMEKMSKVRLTAEEYRIVVRVGLAAVKAARVLVKTTKTQWKADAAYDRLQGKVLQEWESEEGQVDP